MTASEFISKKDDEIGECWSDDPIALANAFDEYFALKIKKNKCLKCTSNSCVVCENYSMFIKRLTSKS